MSLSLLCNRGENMHSHSSSTDLDSSSSSCSAASPGGDTPGCSQQHQHQQQQQQHQHQQQQQHPDRLSSSLDSSDKDSDTGAADSFVPTSPDLRWSVRQTPSVTSASPSPSPSPSPPPSARPKTRSRGGATPAPSAVITAAAAGANKANKCANRKGQRQQSSREQQEEEERRRIRRERNKIAAAKCRNRRRELIDTLQAETDNLEDEKSALQTEIAELLKEKERLEKVLASHKPSCKIPANSDDEEEEAGDRDEEEEDDDADRMLQDPPASPQLLSIIGNGRTPEREVPVGQDMEDDQCIPAAAILGNSNILLCSSAEEEEALEDLRGDDLDDLVPSLEMAVTSEAAASVPDINLSSPFCLSDWETLYKSVANDLESLSTPVMSSSPTCSNYRTVFSFNYAEIDGMAEACEGLKGSLGASELMKDSLNSPTLLAL